MMPDSTQIAKLRIQAEEARRGDRTLVINDQEQIKAIIQMCSEMLRIAAPPVDAYRLDLVSEIRAGSRRALLARGVKDIKILAQTEVGRLREYLELEGVKPPDDIDTWPSLAARWVRQIEQGVAPEVAQDDQPPKPAEDLTPPFDPLRAIDFTQIDGIGMVTAQALRVAGINDLFDLAEMTPEEIREFVNDTPSIKTRARVEDWPAKAQEIIDGLMEPDAPGDDVE